MNKIAIARFRNKYIEAVRNGKAIAIEILFHREARAEQADAAQAGIMHRVCGGIGKMQKRDLCRRFNRGGNLVHGVRAQHEKFGSGGFEGAACIGQQRASFIPVP